MLLPVALIAFLATLLLIPFTQAQCSRFTHGVAAFEVSPNSVTLWTRFEGTEPLQWQLSTTSDFSTIVQSDTCSGMECMQSAATDYTMKFAVAALQPATEYFYQFSNGSAACVSSTGRFLTAPAVSDSRDFTFAVTGDAWLPSFEATFGNYGFQDAMCPGSDVFQVLKRIAENNYDFFFFLGDLSYNDYFVGNGINITEYREAYKRTRVANYIAALESTGVYAQWDDHEVEDGWGNKDIPADKLAEAKQALLEYFHIPEATFDASECRTAPLYRVVKWGADLELFIVDTRSCRTSMDDVDIAQACRPVGPIPGFQPLAGCGPNEDLHCIPELAQDFANLVSSTDETYAIVRELLDRLGGTQGDCMEALRRSDRTLLGRQQMRRLKQDLSASTAKFKIIATQVPLTKLYFNPYDRWEGYPRERDELLSYIDENQIAGVVFLATDVHLNLISHLRIETTTSSRVVAPEFIVGPVAAYTPEQGLRDFMPDFFTFLTDRFSNAMQVAQNTWRVLTGTSFTVGNSDNLYEVLINALITAAHGRAPVCSNFNQYAYAEFLHNAGEDTMRVVIRDCQNNRVAPGCEVEIQAAAPRVECEGPCGSRTCANAADRAEDGLYCLVSQAVEADNYIDQIFGAEVIVAPQTPMSSICSLSTAVLGESRTCDYLNPARCITPEWDVFTDVVFDVEGEVADFRVSHAQTTGASSESIENAVDATEQFYEDLRPYLSCNPGLEFIFLNTQTRRMTIVRDRSVLLAQIPNIDVSVNGVKVTIRLPSDPSNLRIFTRGTTSTPQNYECVLYSKMNPSNIMSNMAWQLRSDFAIPSNLKELDEMSKSQQLGVYTFLANTDTQGEFFFNADRKLLLRLTPQPQPFCFVTTRAALDAVINGGPADANADYSNNIDANTVGCNLLTSAYDSQRLELRQFCRRRYEHDDEDERFYQVEIENRNSGRIANMTYHILVRQPNSQSWFVEFCDRVVVQRNEAEILLLSPPRDGNPDRILYSPEFGVVPLSQLRSCNYDDSDHDWAWWVLGIGILILAGIAFVLFVGMFYFLYLLTRPKKAAPMGAVTILRTTEYSDSVVPLPSRM